MKRIDMKGKINHWAVWLLVILVQVTGFLWYSPWLFGNLWMTLQGKTAADSTSASPIPYLISILGAIAAVYFIAWFILKLALNSLGKTLKMILLLWLCICFFQFATFVAFHGFALGVILIDMGKSLVDFVLIGVVLTLWQKKTA